LFAVCGYVFSFCVLDVSGPFSFCYRNFLSNFYDILAPLSCVPVLCDYFQFILLVSFAPCKPLVVVTCLSLLCGLRLRLMSSETNTCVFCFSFILCHNFLHMVLISGEFYLFSPGFLFSSFSYIKISEYLVSQIHYWLLLNFKQICTNHCYYLTSNKYVQVINYFQNSIELCSAGSDRITVKKVWISFSVNSVSKT